MDNQNYTKSERLRKTLDYMFLSKHGKKHFSAYFIIITKINDKFRSRLGVTVSKKVGNAVTRNRIKRVIREYFRRYLKETFKSSDINVIAKKGLGNIVSKEVFYNLNKAFNRVLNKRKFLDKNNHK